MNRVFEKRLQATFYKNYQTESKLVRPHLTNLDVSLGSVTCKKIFRSQTAVNRGDQQALETCAYAQTLPACRRSEPRCNKSAQLQGMRAFAPCAQLLALGVVRAKGAAYVWFTEPSGGKRVMV